MTLVAFLFFAVLGWLGVRHVVLTSEAASRKWWREEHELSGREDPP